MSIIVDRSLGEFNLSVGTSMAMVKVINATTQSTKADAFADYDHLAINLLTLIRNTQAALGSADASTIMPKQVAELVIDDLQIITSICKSAKVPLSIYLPSYDKLQKDYSLATIRFPSTTKQLFAKDFIDSIASSLVDMIKKGMADGTLESMKFLQFEINAKAANVKPKTLIMTSYAVDLLELQPEAMIKSYTGEIHSKWDFWKLYKKNSRLKDYDYSRLPFNKLFIQLFGDDKTFYGRGYKELERILKVATDKKWDQQTTKERIKMTLKSADAWGDDYDKVDF